MWQKERLEARHIETPAPRPWAQRVVEWSYRPAEVGAEFLELESVGLSDRQGSVVRFRVWAVAWFS